jgi:chorismate mutase
MTTIEDLRRDIDRVDEVLVRLLNERARCVCEIGLLKKAAGQDIYQPDREKDVLHHVRELASEGPLGPEAIGRLGCSNASSTKPGGSSGGWCTATVMGRILRAES